MRLLLDTHLILWAAARPDRLSADARALMQAKENELCFSAASLWEVAIKSALGRSDFRVDPVALRRGLVERSYREIPITGLHAVAAGGLPTIHRDPFDRILVAQARCEGIVLLTVDAALAAYGPPVRRV